MSVANIETRVNDKWRDVTTDEVFKGKTVVVFSLPNAYTPTCSNVTSAVRMNWKRFSKPEKRREPVP